MTDWTEWRTQSGKIGVEHSSTRAAQAASLIPDLVFKHGIQKQLQENRLVVGRELGKKEDGASAQTSSIGE
jgi:hypothetical protein